MVRLFLFWLPGCEHCKAAKPIMRLYKQRNPMVKCLKVDVTKVDWPEGKWKPEYFPTWVLQKPGFAPVRRPGEMKLHELEEWIGDRMLPAHMEEEEEAEVVDV